MQQRNFFVNSFGCYEGRIKPRGEMTDTTPTPPIAAPGPHWPFVSRERVEVYWGVDSKWYRGVIGDRKIVKGTIFFQVFFDRGEWYVASVVWIAWNVSIVSIL